MVVVRKMIAREATLGMRIAIGAAITAIVGYFVLKLL